MDTGGEKGLEGVTGGVQEVKCVRGFKGGYNGLQKVRRSTTYSILFC